MGRRWKAGSYKKVAVALEAGGLLKKNMVGWGWKANLYLKH